MACIDRLLLEASGTSFKAVRMLEIKHHWQWLIQSQLVRLTLTISVALGNAVVRLHGGWHQAQTSLATPPQY